jgi:pimeloyl-ACP methyl ester carboxylesterase
MPNALSVDGTSIAYERSGQGAPVIIVDGALCQRSMGPSRPLAELLSKRFTVFIYDRRGRGESGDPAPYAVAREVEDLEAVVNAAGGAAYVYGISSGAALALEAANHVPGIKKLALFEAPFIVDTARHPISHEYWGRISKAVANDRRGEAVKLFMKAVGVPGFVVALMRLMPVWPKLKAVAHTLPYDGAIVKDYQQGSPLPPGKWNSVTMPTLILDGGKSPVWMRNAMRSLAEVLPNARYRTLPGQTHIVKAPAHVPTLVDFFSES